MEFACAQFVPVGLLCPAHGRGGAYAATVKLTYDVSQQGWARFAMRHDPVLDRSRATPHFPPDLVGAKAACDVALIGGAIDEPGPILFSVGAYSWSREEARLAAPVSLTAGDPAFAPPEQRVAFPKLPLQVAFESRARRIHAAIPKPGPAIAIVQPSAGAAMQPLQPSLDGVLLDPARALVILTFRASFVFEGDPYRDLMLVVSFDDPPWSPDILSRWPRFPCAAVVTDDPPRSSPRAQADSVTESRTFEISALSPRASLPFASVPAAHAAIEDAATSSITVAPAGEDETMEETVMSARAPGVLPFGAPRVDRVISRPSVDAEQTRVDLAVPQSPALPFGASSRGIEHSALPASPSYPRPAMETLSDAESTLDVDPRGFAGAPAPAYVEPRPFQGPPAPTPLPAPISTPLPLPLPAPAPASVSSPEPPSTSPEALAPTLNAAALEATRADVLAFPDRRRAILAERGLTEAQWMAIERGAGPPDSPGGPGPLDAAAALMRSAARKPPKRWRKT